MHETLDTQPKPDPAAAAEGDRAQAIDARLAELFRKQRQDPLMEELRKALRSHLLTRGRP